MRFSVAVLAATVAFSVTAGADTKRVLHPRGSDPSAYSDEKALIQRLKGDVGESEPLFAPSLLRVETEPHIAVLIAALGGDGEHTEEFSWIYRLTASEPVLMGEKLPYYVSIVSWASPGEVVGFTGEYIIDFCGVCDGPHAAPSELVVSVPIAGRVGKDTVVVEVSSGLYSRRVIEDRLLTLEGQTKSLNTTSKARLRHARELLEASRDLFEQPIGVRAGRPRLGWFRRSARNWGMNQRLRNAGLGLIALLASTGLVMGETSNPYAGLRVPPLPEGHRYIEGFLVEDRPGSTYGATRLTHAAGEVISLDRFLYHDKDGQAHWEVKAAIVEPPMAPGQDYFLGTCMMNGEHRRELIALVDVADAEIQTRIVRAWRLNLERETIEPIPVEGVTCYIDGWDA